MNQNIFREYDIRGIVDKEFDIEETYLLTKGILSYFLQKNPKTSKVILGYDGRIHSHAIKENAIKAITELGINVVDIGLCPTPVFYYSLFNSSVNSGIMITASHNPKEYNGIKICLDKKMVWGNQIQEVKQLIQNKNFAPTSHANGSVSTFDATSEYINWIENNFKHLKNIKVNAAIDCGNAVSSTVVPRLIEQMGWKNIKILCEEIDGTFPNHQADPTTLKNMQCVLNELKSNPSLKLGLGLDGDADRMNPMTQSGYLVPGDKLLSIYSQQVLEKNPGAAVVFDIKSSLGLIEALKALGAKGCIAPSGHSLIKEAMVENNALLAGELSCHFFFKDRYFGYDDGIYAMVRLFEILHTTKKSLEELLKAFPKKVSSNEIRISCKEEDKKEIINSVKKFFASKKCKEIITIDGIRAQMDYGWGLARASNTQSVISLRFESDDKNNLEKIKEDFLQALKPYFDEIKLKNEFEF
ncbi:phosphomannomutase/phosphoglucomutase [Candidatus Babeliales bacterium]|nr:phosphomannomutase/phosphoglucomutase [Candidatus Babeliales bacterium]